MRREAFSFLTNSYFSEGSDAATIKLDSNPCKKRMEDVVVPAINKTVLIDIEIKLN